MTDEQTPYVQRYWMGGTFREWVVAAADYDALAAALHFAIAQLDDGGARAKQWTFDSIIEAAKDRCKVCSNDHYPTCDAGPCVNCGWPASDCIRGKCCVNCHHAEAPVPVDPTHEQVATPEGKS